MKGHVRGERKQPAKIARTRINHREKSSASPPIDRSHPIFPPHLHFPSPSVLLSLPGSSPFFFHKLDPPEALRLSLRKREGRCSVAGKNRASSYPVAGELRARVSFVPRAASNPVSPPWRLNFRGLPHVKTYTNHFLLRRYNAGPTFIYK